MVKSIEFAIMPSTWMNNYAAHTTVHVSYLGLEYRADLGQYNHSLNGHSGMSPNRHPPAATGRLTTAGSSEGPSGIRLTTPIGSCTDLAASWYPSQFATAFE